MYGSRVLRGFDLNRVGVPILVGHMILVAYFAQ